MTTAAAKALARHQAGGRAAKAGESFEQLLDKAHRGFDEHGIAKVRRLPVPTKAIGARMRVIVARQGYDYVGTFGPNAGPTADPGAWHGLTIAMEAKSNAERKGTMRIIRDKKDGAGIQWHQLQALSEAYAEWGAAAALVWRNGADRLVLMPDVITAAAREAEAGTRVSIAAAEFVPYQEAVYPKAGAVEDWIYEIRCWLENHGRPGPATAKRKAYRAMEFTTNPAKNQVVVKDDSGTLHTINDVKVMDRPTLERISRESATPQEFEDKLRRTEVSSG